MNTLQLIQVRKAFKETLAVNDLSIEIAPGEVYGLLGPNGAGKTTTVNLAIVSAGLCFVGIGTACFLVGAKVFRWTAE